MSGRDAELRAAAAHLLGVLRDDAPEVSRAVGSEAYTAATARLAAALADRDSTDRATELREHPLRVVQLPAVDEEALRQQVERGSDPLIVLPSGVEISYSVDPLEMLGTGEVLVRRLDALLACYRTGRRPTELLLDELGAARLRWAELRDRLAGP